MTDQKAIVDRSSAVRPRLYLDVDGVLNVYGPDTEDLETATVKAAEGRTYVVRYSEEMVLGLNEIVEEFAVDCVWLTTWLTDGLVLQLMDQIGTLQRGRLLKAPLQRWPGRFSSGWKIQRLLEDQRREPADFVWVDDEQASFAKEVRNSTPNVHKLLLQPDALEGIRPWHLLSMQSFYAGLSGSASRSAR